MSASLTSGVSSFFSSYGILIVLMVAMFAIMIIPQRRRDKKVKDMLGSLKAGDRVRTIGGIYGRVVAITDRTVVIETSEDRVRMEFVKSAIGSVGTLDQQMAAAQRPAKKSKGEPVAEEKVEETTEDKTEE